MYCYHEWQARRNTRDTNKALDGIIESLRLDSELTPKGGLTYDKNKARS